MYCRLPDGELLLVAFHSPEKTGVPTEYSVLYRSADGGKTWSERQALELLGREPYFSVLSDGTVLLTSGLHPGGRGNPEGYHQAYLYRSTDGGGTWEGTRIGSADVPGAAPKTDIGTSRNVLELDDGTLVFAVGVARGLEFLWRSSDRGVTWDKTPCEYEGIDKE